MAQILDVTQIVDRQPVSRFLLGVIFLCTPRDARRWL